MLSPDEFPKNAKMPNSIFRPSVIIILIGTAAGHSSRSAEPRSEIGNQSEMSTLLYKSSLSN